jgi:ferredoxin
MDGVYGMEGNGPRGGTPKKMDILLFSEDPVALDATVCRLVDVRPEYVPTIEYGMKAGMGTYLENEIDLVGDDFNYFLTKNFKVNKKPLKPYKPGSITNFINKAIVQKPFITVAQCVQCGICVNMCPAKPKALFFKNNDKSMAPTYNYDDCIRCFCCQEICPESAIKLKTPVLRKIINFF